MSQPTVVAKTPSAAIVPFRHTKDRERLTPIKLGIQTLIAQGTLFAGDIESPCGMKIDGSIVGNILIKSETDAWVVISETARIEGDVTARVVAICGRVAGKVSARVIVLASTAIIDGDLHYDVVKIAEGAQVNGRLCKNGGGQTPELAQQAEA